jgi:DNA-binding CsgD family transcriptional regulator
MGPEATAAEIANLAERAAPWVDELTDAPSMGFTGVVLALTWADRLEEAERLLNHAVGAARRRGSATDYASAMTLRAKVRHRAGRLRDAEADARAALGVELDSGWSFARGVGPLVASLLDQGRPDEAHAELIAAGLDEEIHDSPPMSPVLLARMRLRAARRDNAGALGDWHEAVRRVQRGRGFNVAWIEDLIAISDVHRTLGDAEAARQDLQQAMQLARRWDTPAMVGQALHAQARAGIAGDPIEVLREAVGLLAESPARLEYARALVTLGGSLRRQGQRVDSREPLRAGYELAHECGAHALADTARGELRASGIRLRREALSGAASLTPSELRIADMALGGAANAEIAQKLFLTVKTVEMHLTNTYRKLDIHRRSEFGPALGQQG